jgi:hypothetical protein
MEDSLAYWVPLSIQAEAPVDVPNDADGIRGTERFRGITGTEQFRGILLNWFDQLQTTEMRFTENVNPESDPYARYTVAYEATFEPSSLGRSRIEIWLTTEDMIATGLETKNRIAARLKLKEGKYKVFAAGNEPSQVTKEGLLALLTVVAEGKIAISATVLPLLGLVKTQAVLLSDTNQFLVSHGYDARGWLTVVDDFESDAFRQVLRFAPW